jgi:hypothetical protein
MESPKVTLRKLDAGSGFQISLELKRSRLISKLHHDIYRPRTMFRRVQATPGVYGLQGAI